MSHLQAAKSLVQAHYADLAQATATTVEAILERRMAPDAVWRAVHPFNLRSGPQGAAEAFWQPFLRAFTSVQRREDIFFAGENTTHTPGTVWTMSMGHLMALFDAPFLNIPPTRRLVMLRYAEFNQVAEGRIVETAFFCDIPHLMTQAGLRPFPDQTAAHLVQPGPRTHDGLLHVPQAEEETFKKAKKVPRELTGDVLADRPVPPPPSSAMAWVLGGVIGLPGLGLPGPGLALGRVLVAGGEGVV